MDMNINKETDMDLDTDVGLEMDMNTDNIETDMYTYMSKKTACLPFQLILISLKIQIAKSVTFIEAIHLNQRPLKILKYSIRASN
jgi:hypothetical protein